MTVLCCLTWTHSTEVKNLNKENFKRKYKREKGKRTEKKDVDNTATARGNFSPNLTTLLQ